MVQLLNRNPALKQDVAGLIEAAIPRISHLMSGRPLVFGPQESRRIEALLTNISKKAGPSLQAALRAARQYLRSNHLSASH